jgi:micrococcal nuclease
MKRALFLLSMAWVVTVLLLAGPTGYVHRPVSAATQSAAENQTLVHVVSVIDGDTIKVRVGGTIEKVRLLGIDTPETVDPRKPVQCFGKAASEKMKSFVLGQDVKLVADSTQGDRDKYGRLLRYVYLHDARATFVNGEMVKQGYAFSYRQYPTKLLAKFNGFEQYAREHNLGLWGSCPVQGAATKPTAPPHRRSTTSRAATGTSMAPVTQAATGSLTCAGKTTCGQMTSCTEAQFYLRSCGVSSLDGDHDGVPCEAICK